MDVNREPQPRRRHSTEFKAQVLAACEQPGATVAGVARSFALNDNLIHDWRRGRSGAATAKAAGTALAEPSPSFVAVTLPTAQTPKAAPVATPAAPARATAEIRLEFKRGATGVSVTWPVSAAAECAAWLREVLR